MQRTYHLRAERRTSLDSGLAARLAALGKRRKFEDGAWIYQRGDASDGFWLIASGQAVLGRYGEEGAFTVYAVLGAGDLFGELAHFAGLERQVDAVADGSAELVWIAGAEVRRLLASEPDFALLLLHSLASQLRTALDRIEDDARLSLTARCGRRLADLAQETDGRVALTQQDLADLLGASRVSVGKALAEFAAAGLIRRGYGWIEVADPARLRGVT